MLALHLAHGGRLRFDPGEAAQATFVCRLTLAEEPFVVWDVHDAETDTHLQRYLSDLDLGGHTLWVTTERRTFEQWLGRKVRAAIGGAYTFDPRMDRHLILINLARIDRTRPRSVEVVVAEELVHMRDRLDGDLRRHAKHGYDRVAHRVAALTGASLEEIRSATVEPKRRPGKYLYACPGCGNRVPRRVRGTWSCARCAPRFDPRFVLQLVSVAGE
ncbi:MAG: hypothetical protein KC442_08725 [Thermomicrobiales bacterium]|nr:hypothetical protein [Thermomicrobiales bacterium]